jgi:Arc/MetJ family transcription regulator
MRTNIVLDDELIAEAQQATGLTTKRAVVEEGLRTLVRLHDQAAARAWRGKLRWEGDLDEMRRARVGDSR